MYLCPICQSALTPSPLNWHCQQNHSFDVARQGYINLLPVQHKKSKHPGDATAMVAARHQFLSTGSYAPLKDKLIEIVSAMVAVYKKSNCHLVDIGCGDGYYTAFLYDALTEAGYKPNLTAIDISKAATKYCARLLNAAHDSHINVLVASSSNLPLDEASCDIITSIFAPIKPKAFHKILKSDGSLVIIKPAKDHLFELREQLFDKVEPHKSEKFLVELAPYFKPSDMHRVTFDLTLDNAVLNHLLTMTPYAYRSKPSKRRHALSLPSLNTTADFSIFVLKKN